MNTKLVRFISVRLEGAPVVADADFLPALGQLEHLAGGHDLTLYVTHAARLQRQTLADAVVRPATRSNHLVGHAIDCNVRSRGRLYRSVELGDGGSLPAPIRAFLDAVRAHGTLRWGGDFGDPVHFDDALNLRAPAVWDEKFPVVQAALAATRERQSESARAGETARLLLLTDPMLCGADVRRIQGALVAHGFALTPDGRFGPQTAEAVAAFQRHAGLTPDGVVGPATRAALLGTAVR